MPVAGRTSDVSESSQADPQEVFEYEQPIHELLFREQLAKQLLGTCLDRQPQLVAKMRAILIDWLVDVAAHFKLRPFDSVLDGAPDRPVPRPPPCPTEAVAAGVCGCYVDRCEV